MTNFFQKKILTEQERTRELVRQNCTQKYGVNVLQDLLPTEFDPVEDSYWCPPYFDQIMCWPPTKAGVLHIEPCPSYIAGFIPEANASRQCLENGSWYIKDNASWSNYTSCFQDKTVTVLVPYKTNISEVELKYSSVIETISETGRIISFATLIIAFAIMICLKKLHCTRNILHMHLFASFILRSFIDILMKRTFVQGLGLPQDLVSRNGSLYFDTNFETNNWLCKLITSIWQYFCTANYSWILMEGLYLHNLIFRALFADSNNSIKSYVIMGWGLPVIIVGAWVTAKLGIDDRFCWTMNDNFAVFMIIAGPVLVSFLFNLCLFLRISMVLYSKLRSPMINEESQRYQKWVKSTLVLVPLFGVHYGLFLSVYFLIDKIPVIKIVYLFFDLLFGSFQGFFVAVLYCFLNGEVKSEIKPQLYLFFTFLATNKYTKWFVPCRKKFLRSVVGRSSVCTTMSCSSLYTNGILHRNSKCRLDSLPKIRVGEKNKEHNCHNPSRRNSKRNSNVPTSETTLCAENYQTKRRSEVEINEETLKMVVHNDF